MTLIDLLSQNGIFALIVFVVLSWVPQVCGDAKVGDVHSVARTNRADNICSVRRLEMPCE